MPRLDLKADVTGAVFAIEKAVGESVAEGDTVLVLESMKMEIPVLALAGGTIAEILVKEGDSVEEGQVVAVLEK
jgi:acetyl-CoA carboxylase biotin carboxyl carrier protein